MKKLFEGLVALVLLGACASPSAEEAGKVASDVSDPPATIGAFAPNLAVVGDELAATWLEPVPGAGDDSRKAAHRLRFSRLAGGEWTAPVSIAEGTDFFANWADFPELVEAGDGTLYAHWLAKTAEDTYAYSVFLARSVDEGRKWEALGKLNSDDTPTEHGFVSLVAEGDGARAFWLDGREMVHQAPMTIRTARLDARLESEEVLDARVCECCGTDAVRTERGPVVVFRDRSDDETRDIFLVRREGARWTEPTAVHDDGWKIAGCPVNGPVIDALDGRMAVAWFTAAEDRARVRIAFSNDAGASFSDPIEVAPEGESGELVLGRVDVAMSPEGGAWISWVSKRGEAAEILVQRIAEDGSRGEERVVAETSPARASGFPILEWVVGRLYVAWVEVGEDRGLSQVRVRRL